MISNATKRSLLRWVHLVLAIPILGYIYSPFEEIPKYASATRFVFVPIIMFAGYWMWRGAIFAILGVALWLGSFYLSGIGAALLSQIALFIAWTIWLVVRARRTKLAGGLRTDR